MKPKSIVLLSGGLDSSLSFVLAQRESDVHVCITFDYGQKSHDREKAAAKKICQYYGIKHQTIPVDLFSKTNGQALLDDSIDIPEPKADQLDDLKVTTQTAKAVWVPNRNGILLNIAAGIAESEAIQNLYVGFNAEEAVTFPDNSKDYVAALNNSLAFSTLNKVTVKAPTIDMVKKDILKSLMQHDFPIQHLWSCYKNQEKMCGSCESCQRLKRAMKENKLSHYTDFFILNTND